MRALFFALGLLLVATTAVVGMAWLSYHTPDAPARVDVAGLSADAVFRFDDGFSGTPGAVEVETLADLWPALGYAQAHDHLVTLVVWRQAARGEMARWLGPAAFRLDRHARRLGFAAHARTAYAALPAAERAALDGFAGGVNAALATRRARLDPTLALYRIHPDAWTGEDVLAIERLAAWIAAAWTLPPGGEQDREVRLFAENDRLLRDLLGADGFSDSRVFAYRPPLDSAGALRLTAQFQTGSSMLPVLPTVRVRVGDARGVGTFLPGTPFALAGRLGDRRWAVRPYGTAALAVRTAPAPRPRRETLRAADGALEDLLVAADDTLLHLGGAPVPPAPPAAAPVAAATSAPPAPLGAAPPDDTLAARSADTLAERPAAALAAPAAATAPAWWLAWGGLRGTTDASLWLSLWQRGPARAPALFAPAHVWTDGTRLVVLGTPATAGAAAVFAPAPYAEGLAARLATPAAHVGGVPEDDATSEWARRVAQALVARVVPGRLTTPHERDAFQYLRNWTHRYSASDIAPTLLDAWLVALDRQHGLRSGAVVADTGLFAAYRTTEAFRAAVGAVARAHGSDPRGWRWAEARPAWRHPPLASVGARLGLPTPAPHRFASLRLPGATHPSTLAFQPGDPAGRATAPMELRLGATASDDVLRMLPPPSGVLALSRAHERSHLYPLGSFLPRTTLLSPRR